MKIVGKSNKVLDADLLARLAQASDHGVSKAEVQSAIKSTRSELKDQFDTSTRGLDRAAKAVSNTLELAIKSGWINSGASTKVVDAFLKGSSDGSLKDTLGDIRDAVKQSRTGGTSYGGSTRSTRTAPRSTRSYGGSSVSRPAPRRTTSGT